MNPTKTQIRLQPHSQIQNIVTNLAKEHVITQISNKLGDNVWNFLWGKNGAAIKQLWSHINETTKNHDPYN